MTSTEPAAALAVPAGLPNFRDAGGLPAGPGRRVRRGLLFRSGSPQFMAPEGAGQLVTGLGVRTQLDLRRTEEAEREGRGPLAGADLRYLSFPLISLRREKAAGAGLDVPLMSDWVTASQHYLGYLATSGPQVAAAVTALAEPGALPALVHCAAGKDRTGVVIGFALSVAGVGDEDVAAEYACSPDGVREVVDLLLARPGYAREIAELPAEAHLTEEHYMAGFLTLVRGSHGSPREWLIAQGVPERTLDRLASALTEPATD